MLFVQASRRLRRRVMAWAHECDINLGNVARPCLGEKKKEEEKEKKIALNLEKQIKLVLKLIWGQNSWLKNFNLLGKNL
jgi:hypothetical protein